MLLEICNQIGLLKILLFINTILHIIFIIIPIGMIITVSIDFSKNVLNPEANSIKNNNKILLNRIISAIMLFLVPYIINIFMIALNSLNVSFASCYVNAKKNNIDELAINQVDQLIDFIENNPDEVTESDLRKLYQAIEMVNDDEKKAQYIVYYKELKEEYNNNNSSKENDNNNNNNSSKENDNDNGKNSNSNTKILIAAGHSYEPYCSKNGNECRYAMESSGYSEVPLTRDLAQKLKSQLIKKGYSADNVDIANEILGEDFSDPTTSKSLRGEIVAKSDTFNSIDWKKYKYAIEIHFNALPSGHNSSGTTTLCKVCPGLTEKIDNSLRKDITKLLGTKDLKAYKKSTTTETFFDSMNTPFTYLEVEFYDNKTAIENYLAHSDEVAEIIAKNIKKYYP